MCGLSKRSGPARFAGLALTVKATTGPLGTYSRADFAVGKVIDLLEPGHVLAFAAGGSEISCFGGLATFAAQRQRAAAVLIDGACRDLDEIRAVNLWVASRHVTPQTGKTRVQVEEIGTPVELAGRTVAPGDLFVGDDTEIVVIPRTRITEVFAIALMLSEKDAEVERLLRSGKSFSEAARTADYL